MSKQQALTTPVFVIHGVNERNPEGFNRAVDTLATKVGIEAHPVYWGGPGASYKWVARTVPGAPDDIRDRDPGSAVENDALADFLVSSRPPSVGDSGDGQIPESAGTPAVVGMFGGRRILGDLDSDPAALARKAREAPTGTLMRW
jgi:hypothetical protein